ncbi:inositol polyphosphate 5-phosphatase [Tritrichomonas foetus]|uniref:Inositol polyphosphate 5-phosphatase n=1 Tax=Tritrichomonas foetus TaxID=1144522 RepID=A0A1J4J6R5_9EUKA|nr:inositol polyphosphate 5-phosphatase [Tritrichomonas foetus]|eukprot:OHS94922.1 inositol polyphosphate 5-phosphatase [Tritrichomonas foetus]
MNDFINSCGYWIDFNVAIEGRSNPLVVGISLEDNSLSRAYLYFRENSNVVSCFPINCFISCSISSLELSLIFFSYGNQSISFISTSSKHCSILSSQISICAKLSRVDDDKFVVHNKEFINKYSKKRMEFPQNIEAPPLFPIDFLQRSHDTWNRRNDVLNEPYFTIPFLFPIMYYTWNVGQGVPDERTPILARHIFKSGALFIVIALEEIDFSASAIIFGGSPQCKVWSGVFDKASAGLGYKLLHEDSLGGVYVRYMVKEEFVTNISSDSTNLQHSNIENNANRRMGTFLVQHKQVRLGTAGVTCNKSALISCFSILNRKFIFVAAHLTAHDQHYAERNLEMIQLMDIIHSEFPSFDYVSILGDLNYRVDLPYEKVIKLCDQNEIDEMLKYDQLHQFMKENDSFQNFYEEKITFKPTFKFDEDKNVYDTSKKRRVPSWTDRILLYSSKPRIAIGPTDSFAFETDILRHTGLQFEFNSPQYFQIIEPELNYPKIPTCKEYISYSDILFSDHRPVSALYNFILPIIDEAKYKMYISMKMQKLDEIATLSIPRCKIEPRSFESDGFTKLTLTNTSCTFVKWKADIIPENVLFFPNSGELNPLETCAIEFHWSKVNKDINIAMLSIEDGPSVTLEFWGK